MNRITGFPAFCQYLINSNKNVGNYYLIKITGHSDRWLLKKFQAYTCLNWHRLHMHIALQRDYR